MIKNITLSAEELLIEEARKRARTEQKSLNTVFREWLFRYAFSNKSKDYYTDLMSQFEYSDAGGRFRRDDEDE